LTRYRLLAACILLCAIAAPAGATPVISSSFFYTANWAPNDLVSQPEGAFVFVGAIVNPASTSDPISSLSVVGTQGSLTQPLSFNPYVQTRYPGLYQALMPLAGAVTGVGWSITATDGTGSSAPSVTAPIFNPVVLPFVSDISVSDASTTPTVSWTLPDLTTYSVDSVFVRIIDANTENQLFFQAELGGSPLATSLEVPDGILQPGQSYIYRVSLVDFGPGGFENTSYAFSGATTVPEPATSTLLLAGLGVGLLRARSQRSAGVS